MRRVRVRSQPYTRNVVICLFQEPRGEKIRIRVIASFGSRRSPRLWQWLFSNRKCVFFFKFFYRDRCLIVYCALSAVHEDRNRRYPALGTTRLNNAKDNNNPGLQCRTGAIGLRARDNESGFCVAPNGSPVRETTRYLFCAACPAAFDPVSKKDRAFDGRHQLIPESHRSPRRSWK